MNRVFTSSLVGALLLVALPVAAEQADDIIIQISTVLASNGSGTRQFDPRLASLKPELKRLRFKHYHLIGRESRSASAGDQCGIALPGGRYLHVTTKESTEDYLQLNILLNEGNRPVINTDVKVDHDSVLLLGGPRDSQGTLLITISAVRVPMRAPGTGQLSQRVDGSESEKK